ncbi:MAG: cyclic nucleotide-binding domain-containing protein [Candidatus Methylacidiphilales bacterium]|nr:cyclic nucleotide-binding domain-containing protein [Candidatus Methylacidiphilales bacterium]
MSGFDRPALPATGWVSLLKPEDRDLLASYGEFIGVHPDHDMIRQGDNQNHVFFVISGKLEVRKQGLQDDIIVGVIGADESIGELAIFDPSPASASVRALEFSQVWKIDRDSLFSFIQDSPVAGNTILLGLCEILSRRLREASSRLVDAKTGFSA